MLSDAGVGAVVTAGAGVNDSGDRGVADRLAAGAAPPWAFVLGHMVIELGVARKRPVAHRAIDAGIKFVFVAEHGSSWGYFLG